VGRNIFWLLLAGATFASPVTAAVCYLKGKRVLALMGAATLPTAGFIFIAANNPLAKSDGGWEDLIAGIFAVMALMLVFAVGAIPSLFGAVRFARTNSTWALTRYDEDKMNTALARAASNTFFHPPAWK